MRLEAAKRLDVGDGPGQERIELIETGQPARIETLIPTTVGLR
jgi:hypothetical protein